MATKLKNSYCDKTLKLKLSQNSQTQIVTKISKTQILTKLKNSNTGEKPYLSGLSEDSLKMF